MSLSCSSTNPGGNFESGRVHIKEDLQIKCGYKGNTNTYPEFARRCGPIVNPIIKAVPESTYLTNKMTSAANCKITHINNTTSEQNTISKQINAINCSTSPFNADNRFSQYYRNNPVPCPLLFPEYINATQPKLSLNTCILPSF